MPRKRLLLPLAILAGAAVVGGCAYAPPIQQGNYIDNKNVDQIEIGMSEQQVAFVLGTSMVQDPFRPGRWDYVYYLNPNDGSPIEQRHVIIWFKNGKVTRIDKSDMPKRGSPKAAGGEGSK
jgi:outer membrane protein assembly factor BamE